MTIPTSNRPEEGEGKKPAAAPKITMADLEQDIASAIAATKEEVDKTLDLAKKTEKSKLKTYWDVGTRLKAILDKLPSGEHKGLVDRFVSEAGAASSMYYLSVKFVATFSKEDFDAAKEAGATVQALKAVSSIKNDALREKAMKMVIEEKADADRIRVLTGTKGSRKAAVGKRNKAKDAEKPALKVFIKANDRMTTLHEIIGSCFDATGRLSQCKTPDEHKEAMGQIAVFRKHLAQIMEEGKAFLEQTKALASKK